MVLLALVSRRASVVAKRWDVRCATSGSSQRDRLRVEGSLARWLRRGRSNRQGVFDGAKRGALEGQRRLGCGRPIELREAVRRSMS